MECMPSMYDTFDTTKYPNYLEMGLQKVHDYFHQ